MMQRFDEFEGKSHFDRILDIVEAGEEVTITRNGEPVARLVPHSGVSADQKESPRAPAQQIRKRTEERGTGLFNWGGWKSHREEGRAGLKNSTLDRSELVGEALREHLHRSDVRADETSDREGHLRRPLADDDSDV